MPSTKPWVHAHAPKTTKDVVGHEDVIAHLLKYVQTYKRGQKPILLAGPPGIGKTTLVHVIAEALDLELLEVNASDARNKEHIETLVGEAAKQQSLFFRGKLLLIDEVDGLSGQQDRGGVSALVDLIPKSAHPLIFTANDAELDKLKPLKKACEVITLQAPSHEHITKRLAHIASHEGVSVEHELLATIARRTGGDMRAAINDLQSAHTGKKITKEDIEALADRERTEQIEAALLRIFKTTSAQVALPAFSHVDEDVDGLLLWIDENLPKEYQNADDLARGFEALAEADKFFGRIRKWQYYRYYVYIYDLLSAGIALAKTSKYPGTVTYKPTGRILRMWIANQRNAKRKALAKALSPHLHTSTRRIVRDVLPYLKVVYLHEKKEGRKALAQRYGLDEEALEWFEK